MNIAVIGTGYVGLVTGACFAEFGVFVTCVDKDEKKIRALKKGEIPFYEPGLSEIVRKNTANGRLRFTTDVSDAVKSSLVIFIAVGTPQRKDGSADLKYVMDAAREIAASIDGYKVVVSKSTVPVGTGERLKRLISRNLKKKVEFDIVSNPEFLREGSAIEEFMKPNRVVIGADSDRSLDIMKGLYRPLYLIETPFVITNVKGAELIKYASNCFLAVKISFINEMANLCERLGVDVHTIAKGMGLDRRIGSKFLHPGPGFGGSCFPKDTRALVNIAGRQGMQMKIVNASIEVNEDQRRLMVDKIKSAVGSLKGKEIAVLGLSFKPRTDDIRESPAIYIIKNLLRGKAKVRAYDPVAMKNAKAVCPDVYYAKDPYAAVRGADALVIVTEWEEFRNLDLGRIKGLLRAPNFLDLRNIYEPSRMKELGFRYSGVGRGA